MDDLKKLVSQTVPREISGSRAINRFDYQKNWAICLLLELYTDKNDFLLLIDYHDDIAVLDAEEGPKFCSFYQVKTKDPGVWTISELVKRNDDKNSIIGKLFLHTIKFGNVVEKLTIVSNARLEAILNSGEKTSNLANLQLSLLNPKSFDELCNALKIEFDLSEKPLIKEILYYLHSDLSPHGHSEQVQGKLVDFFDRINPSGKHNIKAIYRTLFDEFSRKNDFEFIELDWSKLKKAKGFSKKDTERLINEVMIADRDQVFDRVITQLQSEKADFMLVRNLSTRVKLLNLELIYRQNSSLLKADAIISKEILEDKTTDNFPSTLLEYLQRKHADLLIAYPELSDLETEDVYLLIGRNLYA